MMPKPKATYQVTTPDGKVEKFHDWVGETPMQFSQRLANDIVRQGHIPAGNKVQRVTEKYRG